MAGKAKYDESEIYEKEIEKYVREILLLCDKYKIPAFMTFAVKDDGKSTEYESEILSPMYEDRELSLDRISEHALVMSGFDVVPDKRRLLDDGDII